MKEELLEKLIKAHNYLMQVKTSGDDSIAMAQGILMVRDVISTANKLPTEQPEPKS